MSGTPKKRSLFDEIEAGGTEAPGASLFDSIESGGAEPEQSHPSFIDYQAPEGPQGQQPGPSGIASASEGPSLYEEFLGALRNGPTPGNMAASPAGQAISGGITHGLSAGAMQLIPGGMGDFYKDVDQVSRNASPALYDAANAGGAMMQPIGGGGGLLRNMATQGAQAAVNGGVSSFADSQNQDSDDLYNAYLNAGWEGAKGAALTGALGLPGVIGKAEKPLAQGASAARRAAVTTEAPVFKTLAEEEGFNAIDDMGGEIDRLAPPNKIIPRSSREISEQLGARASGAADQGNIAIQQAKDQLGNLPQPANRGIAQAMDQGADTAMNSGLGSGTGQAAAYRSNAEALDRMPPVEDPYALRDLKTRYDQATYKAPAGTNESFMGRANQDAGNAARGQMDDYMSQADPDVYESYLQSNKDYGSATQLSGMARQTAAGQEAGGGMFAKLGGAAIGGGVGYMTGGTYGAALGAGLGWNARQAASSYGPDLGANVASLAAKGAGRIGAAGGAANALGGQVGGAMSGMDEGFERQKQAIGESTPSSTLSNINDALISEPSVLGPYRGQFENAGRTPDGTKQLLNRLQNDQTWRTQFLPMFQGAR